MLLEGIIILMLIDAVNPQLFKLINTSPGTRLSVNWKISSELVNYVGKYNKYNEIVKNDCCNMRDFKRLEKEQVIIIDLLRAKI